MISSAMSLHQAYAEVARQHAEREALVCGDERLTYGELASRIEALAASLHELGIEHGDRVACLLWPGWHFAVLFFSLMRLGAVAVPLNPQLRRRQLAHILREVQASALVVDESGGLGEDAATVRSLVAEVAPACVVMPVGGAAGDPADLDGLVAAGRELPVPQASVSPDDLAVILYTSGTTGQPKGVMHSHRGLISPVVASTRLRRMWLHTPSPAQLARMAGLVARYGTRLLQAAGRPQTMLTVLGGHAIGGIEIMLQALLMGDHFIVMPHFHPVEMLRCVERERATVLVAAPLALSVLMRMRDLQKYDLSSLLIVGTGSAPCPPELARQVQRLGCAIHIGYGTTEIGGGICATSVEDSADHQAETVGRALSGMEVRVVDEERRPLPPGEVGELACRGESRMLGYYRAPELTETVLDDEGWYYTGDLAVMDEQGFIRIVDRKKDIIIRGGQNIYPIEIEQFLGSLPGVSEAAVVGVPGSAGDERVWAFLLCEEGATVGAQEVLALCRETLETFKIPDEVRFVSELPRSSLGKVQKTQLRAQALSERAQ